MDDTTDADEKQEISLLDSLDGKWLKLPLAVMKDVGTAAQTLAGIMAITNRETFASVQTIAGSASVKLLTAKRHIKTLHERGWIENKGRERTRRGQPRRTATIAETKKTKTQLDEYAILPWWACCNICKAGKLPWSAKAILSIVMARLCSLKAAAERDDQDDELEGVIENMGGDDRFQFSLTNLEKQTGLTRESIVAAKRWLFRNKIIRLQGCDPDDHDGITKDTIAPNWDFRVIVTPAGEGYIRLNFGMKKG
jgi:hypothetical protein